MNQTVVAAAQEEKVGESRRPAVCPMNDMMRVAPAVWPVTTGEPAVAIAHDDGPSHGCGDDRRLPADAQRFGAPGHDNPPDRSITCQLPGHLGLNWANVVKLA